tara:strand:+ start:142 stop:291 length:150 start_codon:yes stop_codon:yes gene_type:complete
MRELARIETKTDEIKNIIDKQISILNDNRDIIQRMIDIIDKLGKESKTI